MKQQITCFILGEVDRDVRGAVFQAPLAKSAPVYSGRSLPHQVVISQQVVDSAGRQVTVHVGGFPPAVLLVRARADVDDIFSRSTFDREQELFLQVREIFQAHGGSMEFCEEYSVFLVSGYRGEPEQFLTHAPLMAGLLKSERLELDPKEVEYTLRSQIKYGRNDLSIIDWDGAFLFDETGDFDEDIELLTLANLQLLRHRLLDCQLDNRLTQMAGVVERPFRGRPSFRSRELMGDLTEVVKARRMSISELQRLERDIKLIGDWYSARFFEAVTAKFKIEEWRKSIMGKLDSLEDIYSIISENFAISWKNRAEWVQIILFFILQGFWFLLIALEFMQMTHNR